MRIKALLLSALMIGCIGLPAAMAQEYGKIRPLNERAAEVVRQRNGFVTQVLTSYGIAHEVNRQGAVVRIQVDGRWRDVKAIDIVPLVEQRDDRRQVIAHELLFTMSGGGALSLRSELRIP